MRRFLVLGGCALYLVFGSLAGLSHVHAAAEHHDPTQTLHLDHAHFGDAAHHDRHHPHPHGTAPEPACHVDHHTDTTISLGAIGVLAQAGPRVPAMTVRIALVEPTPTTRLEARDASPPPESPARRSPTPSRAPPV
ncbi:MAG: hypothetical protein GY716_04065 [bacterium]|nr:hypothetical protein [bacterium]